MTIKAPSEREAFKDIGDFYVESIEPFLKSREDARQRAVMHAGLVMVASAVAAFAIFKYIPFEELNVQASFITGFAGVAISGWRLNKTRNDIAQGLFERIAAHFGFDYRLNLDRPAHHAVFDRLKLLPNFNVERWEDEVCGERRGAKFWLCEANLKYRSSGKNKSTRTVFHGQLLVIDYDREFLGETVVKRDAGVFNRLMKPGRRFQRVGLASSRFEKSFEAWSTDQVEARVLLDPIVLERFEELDRLFDGAKLRAAFSGGKLYLAMETGDKLNMGSMFTPLTTSTRFEQILKELDLIFDLIDVLLARVNNRLDGAFSVDAVRAKSG